MNSYEKAARGLYGNIHPWGDDYEFGRCYCTDHNMPAQGTLAAQLAGKDRWNGASVGWAPVDAFSPAGDSPFGGVAMVGNLGEWTASDDPHWPGRKIWKGGGQILGPEKNRCSWYRSEYPDNRHAVGFRCVVDANTVTEQLKHREAASYVVSSASCLCPPPRIPTHMGQSAGRRRRSLGRDRALKAFRLEATDRIPHWEHFSNPAFEEMVTGIDPWQHPQKARQRLLEIVPMDVGSVPLTDDPIERLPDDRLSFTDEDGSRHARWGTGKSWHWDWGKHFRSIDDVLAYDPMEHLDQRGTGIVAEYDYRLDVDQLAAELQERLDAGRAVTDERALVIGGFYNTLFMWPLMTFGWELFLELGAAYEDEARRIMTAFAERSRKIFQAWAKTNVEVVASHDDICYARGPVFSPAWLRRMIYPYYEEFWGYFRQAGIKVIFISDGNVDAVADDVFACVADGIMSEPFTNWRAWAERYPNKVFVGDGNNRVIATGDREAIFAMVREMCAWGKRYPGYFLCCGNHLPYTLPAEGIKHYFDASQEYGQRT